jgi:DNA-binding HxlR family transcriptional regulator
VYAEAPPRVEYELTPLGKRFMQPVRGLVEWLQVNWSAIRAARDKFDRRPRSREAASSGLTASH